MNSNEVQGRLAAFRRDLYGGRGPGISHEEWLRNTSLRPEIAGVPTAALREEVHLRTLRARGERDRAERQTAWAEVQFPATPRDDDGADDGAAAATLLPTLRDRRPRHRVRRGVLGALGVTVLALLRARSRRGRSS